jgi:GNAT superfamily N-acetyltransferase
MYSIRVLELEDCEKAQVFLFEMIEILFHMKRDIHRHADIFNLKEHYLLHPKHEMMGCFDLDQQLIGVIAFTSYIDRFKGFSHRYSVPTAEIVRCYIKPEKRRMGIGKRLFEYALSLAKAKEYNMLYLHTHPHLPGGYDFWLKTGFEVFHIDAQPATIHMERRI